jgi:hypothetical protein
MNDACADISARYSKFAEDEAHGKSPLYEELARRIAGDPTILAYFSAHDGRHTVKRSSRAADKARPRHLAPTDFCLDHPYRLT